MPFFYPQSFICFCYFYVVYSNPITGGAFGVLDISGANDLSTRQRLEEATRLDCAYQRTKALNRIKSNGIKIYVPICSARNPLMYDKTQCDDKSSYCWCVDVYSGEPKIGSSIMNRKPNCDQILTSTSLKKKKKNNCEGQKRTRFLRRLILTFKTEMIMSGINESKVSRETAIRWKFNQLNTNKNAFLDRKEWKPYKLQILKWKNARHCVRNLFKTCDLNADRKLTSNEWRKCLVQEINLVPAKRPDQLNPFLYILRPDQV